MISINKWNELIPFWSKKCCKNILQVIFVFEVHFKLYQFCEMVNFLGLSLKVWQRVLLQSNNLLYSKIFYEYREKILQAIWACVYEGMITSRYSEAQVERYSAAQVVKESNSDGQIFSSSGCEEKWLRWWDIRKLRWWRREAQMVRYSAAQVVKKRDSNGQIFGSSGGEGKGTQILEVQIT